MKVCSVRFNGRPGWQIDNGRVQVIVLEGGGHIAALIHAERPGLNPLWVPVWKPIEPWKFRQRHRSRYELRLLAGISGHNLCLGWFGDPSADESRVGMECHGEASIVRWQLLRKNVTSRSVRLVCACELPTAQMELTRTLSADAGSDVIEVTEELKSRTKRDMPFTQCQHVTFGPPFLEKGVTLFDMPATQGHTFPSAFSQRQRLAANRSFSWPRGPAANGRMVDLRVMGRELKSSSDFSTQLIDMDREQAWFSALNPRLGLMAAYVWRRKDYPWVGNWEENYCRQSLPWAGKSLTRGMEFANTPFPIGLRKAVDMGKFQGVPTFQWLPAMGRIRFEYDIILRPVPRDSCGVAEIGRRGRGYDVALLK